MIKVLDRELHVHEAKQLVDYIVKQLIAEFGCEDCCESCQAGVALGNLDEATGKFEGTPDCIAAAFDAGYKACSDEADESLGITE